MTQDEFAAYVGSLESHDTNIDPDILRSLHAVIGIAGEAGELLDQVKRVFVYHTQFDTTHLVEEMGDLFHYLTMLMNIHGFNLDEIREANVRKLHVRYPGGYSHERAVNRNTDKECIALEEPNADDI